MFLVKFSGGGLSIEIPPFARSRVMCGMILVMALFECMMLGGWVVEWLWDFSLDILVWLFLFR